MTEAEIQGRLRELDALERIATALEQLTLEYMEARNVSRAPQSAVAPQGQRPPAPAPQMPEPPPLGAYEQRPPANGAPLPYQAPVFAVGAIHMTGHKPLKTNSRGLFCPTKMPDGSWCPWRVTP